MPGGGAEQRPEDWWRALVAATRRLLARHDGSAAEIAACCARERGSVPVDEAGALRRGAPHRVAVRRAARMRGMSLPRIRHGVQVLGDHIDRVDTTQTLTDLRRFDARAILVGADRDFARFPGLHRREP